MGIRMHLCVGYGLDFAHPDNAHLKRARLMDYENVIENDALFAEWRDSTIRWADSNEYIAEKAIFAEKMGPPRDLADMVAYQPEFGLEDKAILFPAMSRKQFHRYGDLLDIFTYEAQLQDKEFRTEPEWMEYPGCLYPYIGLMRANPDSPLGVEKYWVPCYKDDPEHKDATPWAPWHLWFLLRTIFGLTDEETTRSFLTLRPAVYRYFC